MEKKMVAMSSSSLSIKLKKFKRGTLHNCSNHKVELKETSAEQVSDDHKNVEGTIEVMQSTVNEVTNEDAVHDFPGLPLALSFNHTMKPKVIFVLEKASLVPALVGKSYQILNSNKHADYLRRKHLDPYSYRPDIIHDALLEINSSRLSLAGRVEAIYVKTDKGVLIKADPHARIPASLEKFCSMMLHLLQKLSIKAVGSKRGKLLSVIANPVTKHLPVNSLKIGLSFSSKKACQLKDYISAVPVRDDVKLVFVVGAMAHGKIESNYTDDLIAVSKYPLSAETCVQQINNALESEWKAW